MTSPPSAPKKRKPLWFRLLRIVAIFYVAVLGLMMIFENRFVYFPVTAEQAWLPKPTEAILDVEMTSPTGQAVHGWYYPRAHATQAILFCHGNGDNLSGRGHSIVKMGDRFNCSVLIVDYPGYGKTSGRPSEAGVYDAAQAGADWLVAQGFARNKIILHGESLGGAVAIELAARAQYGGLSLVRTFTSAPAVGQQRFPFLPIKWLMRNRYDSLSKIGQINMPVVITSAGRDRVVPAAHGRVLYEAFPGPKEFIDDPDSDHNDKIPDAYWDAFQRLLLDR